MTGELIFFQPLPGVDLPAEEIWETFRNSGKWRKEGEDLLEHLPVTEALEGIRSLPGWVEDGLELPDRDIIRFRTPDGNGKAVTYWYGQKPGPRKDRILCLYCDGLTETQVQDLIRLMDRLHIPLRLRIDS